MKQTKTMTDAQGNVWTQVTELKQKTSYDQTADLLDGVNQSLGRSLTPFSIRGGFSVSTSWLLFGLIFIVDPVSAQTMFGLWLLSLFVKFR